MEPLTLVVLDNDFAVYRFPPHRSIPPIILESSFYWVGKTNEELSLVCDAMIEINDGVKDGGWSCFKVLGPLDFSLTGVLAGISAALASAQISIFALSTFDTDYILVKSIHLKGAIAALKAAGYAVRS